MSPFVPLTLAFAKSLLQMFYRAVRTCTEHMATESIRLMYLVLTWHQAFTLKVKIKYTHRPRSSNTPNVRNSPSLSSVVMIVLSGWPVQLLSMLKRAQVLGHLLRSQNRDQIGSKNEIVRKLFSSWCRCLVSGVGPLFDLWTIVHLEAWRDEHV